MERWLERYRGILFFILVVLVIAGIGLLQVLRPAGSRTLLLHTATPPAEPQAVPQSTPTPHPLRVYVSGAVQVPDVYALPPDSIVKDALLAAGGPAADADLDRVNLASPLADGQQIYIPHQGEENLPVQPPSATSAQGQKVNINTADLAAFESLPGIGPALAQRIVDYRQAHGPFADIQEIMAVSGIGPATFEQIQDLIRTE